MLLQLAAVHFDQHDRMRIPKRLLHAVQDVELAAIYVDLDEIGGGAASRASSSIESPLPAPDVEDDGPAPNTLAVRALGFDLPQPQLFLEFVHAVQEHDQSTSHPCPDDPRFRFILEEERFKCMLDGRFDMRS